MIQWFSAKQDRERGEGGWPRGYWAFSLMPCTGLLFSQRRAVAHTRAWTRAETHTPCWAQRSRSIRGASVTGCLLQEFSNKQTNVHKHSHAASAFFLFFFPEGGHSAASVDWRSLEMLRHGSVWNNQHNTGSSDDFGSAGALIISITGTSWLHLKAINVPSEPDCVFLQGMFKNSAAPDCWPAWAHNISVVLYFLSLSVCSYNARSQWGRH